MQRWTFFWCFSFHWKNQSRENHWFLMATRNKIRFFGNCRHFSKKTKGIPKAVDRIFFFSEEILSCSVTNWTLYDCAQSISQQFLLSCEGRIKSEQPTASADSAKHVKFENGAILTRWRLGLVFHSFPAISDLFHSFHCAHIHPCSNVPLWRFTDRKSTTNHRKKRKQSRTVCWHLAHIWRTSSPLRRKVDVFWWKWLTKRSGHAQTGVNNLTSLLVICYKWETHEFRRFECEFLSDSVAT